MKYLISNLFIIFSVSAYADSYQSFMQEIHGKKYVIKKGDTLSQILENQGYRGIYINQKQNRHLNPILQTMWLNGLTHAQLLDLEVGQEIYLPVSKSTAKRGIASVESASESEIPDKVIRKIVIDYAEEKE